MYGHRYITPDGKPLLACVACKSSLLRADSVLLTALVNNTTSELCSCLTENGVLVDIDRVIANGYHAGSACASCGENLAEYEDTDYPLATDEPSSLYHVVIVASLAPQQRNVNRGEEPIISPERLEKLLAEGWRPRQTGSIDIAVRGTTNGFVRGCLVFLDDGGRGLRWPIQELANHTVDYAERR